MEKKIAFVISHLGKGGHQKMMGYVADNCVDVFDEVHMISIYNSEIKTTMREEIKVQYAGQGLEKQQKKLKGLSKIRRLLEEVTALRQTFKKINPNIVCAFGIKDIIISLLASIGLKLQVIGSERRSPASNSFKVRLLSKLFYGWCNGMVFQLESAKSFFGKKIRGKAIVIPNPFKGTKSYSPCPLSQRRKVITAAAARFEPQKGIDVLLEAFKIVNERHSKYKLEIYGSGGLLNEYKKQIAASNLENNVRFPGLVESVTDVVWDSTLFVLPSRVEGIPNVLMEVLGAGVPTVSTDCPPGGPRLLTNNGERGLLVDVENVEEMAEAICKIIEDDDLSKKLSKKGLEVTEEFSTEKIANLWKEYLCSFFK
jgi:GalNAc-alpha-(1->4)-GalNAc-alpha-(1->3)-diNAcBac-PP-undecaprenol alpha-1,4-N-acetyl-D-galactosaminyltransferase